MCYARPVQEDSLGGVVVVGTDFLELEVLPLLRVQGALLLRGRGGALEVGITSCSQDTESEQPRRDAGLLGCSGGS